MEAIREKTAAEVAISTLKSAVQDLQLEDERVADDLYLLRWLKARAMDPEKAERMLRRSVKWREETGVKNLMTRDVDPELIETFSLIQRVTRTGELVYYVNPHINLKKILEKFGVEETYVRVKQTVVEAEDLNIQWNKETFQRLQSDVITEDSIKGNVLVMDWKYVSAGQVSSIKCFKFLRLLALDYLKYIPSLGSALILINCPKIALHTVNFFKSLVEVPFLTIEVYDDDEEKWKEALLKRVHPDELLVQYGGKVTNKWAMKKGSSKKKAVIE